MPRHQVKPIDLPEWAKRTPNVCLQVVAEDAYQAKRYAVETYRAIDYPSCQEPLRAAEKELAKLGDENLAIRARVHAGERASRYFWHAKTCARRLQGLPPD